MKPINKSTNDQHHPRQPVRDFGARRRERVVGKLPATAGWQPALPRVENLRNLRRFSKNLELFENFARQLP